MLILRYRQGSMKCLHRRLKTMYSDLQRYIESLLAELDTISAARKALLGKLAAYISRRRNNNKPVRLNFICTHNSRRSHICQIWATTAVAFFDLNDIQCFSGGTEATAFNPRAVAAMERAGFRISSPGGDNPHYQVSFSEDAPALECFSKVYNDSANPGSDFAAVMTCSDADANCPYIPGATRLTLTYEDPKAADSTPAESARYDERVRQIGRELFYVVKRVKENRLDTRST